jgi:hypothetical protein
MANASVCDFGVIQRPYSFDAMELTGVQVIRWRAIAHAKGSTPWSCVIIEVHVHCLVSRYDTFVLNLLSWDRIDETLFQRIPVCLAVVQRCEVGNQNNGAII